MCSDSAFFIKQVWNVDAECFLFELGILTKD